MAKVLSMKNVETASEYDLQEIVTRNIKVALALRGLNQKDLANVLGFATSSLSQKFTGRNRWNLEDISKAARFFNVEPAALVAGHGFEPWTSGYSSVITSGNDTITGRNPVITPDDDATNRESCHSSYLDSSVTTLMAINEDAPVIQQYEQAREQ